MYISTHPVLHYTQYVCPSLGGKAKGVGAVQRAKKGVSDSLGLVDFAIGLVNSVLNLPDKWSFVGNSNCVGPKNIYTPPAPKEATFVLDPSPPGISIPGGACHTPSTPCNFRNFPTWLGSPWKDYFRQKMPFHYTFTPLPSQFPLPSVAGCGYVLELHITEERIVSPTHH